jgi:putative membrane protein
MYGYWFGMSLVWWIFWVIVVAAFFAFLTPVPRRNARPPTDPLEILRRRYAAGEITTAEYDERRDRLLDRAPRTSATGHAASAVPPPAHPEDVEHRITH